ncbi:hypothetical protein OAD66_06005 [Bacteroidia bacterium]|nr:hypothetical protein [Bacteroidia bacterium]MDB9882671.1 hypothetical protein [Bacteroidia bacterium]
MKNIPIKIILFLLIGCDNTINEKSLETEVISTEEQMEINSVEQILKRNKKRLDLMERVLMERIKLSED